MTATSRLEVVVLAAGMGTRMRSDLPKVLHRLAGRSLLAHVLATSRALHAARIHVVYGHGGDQVPRSIDDPAINWVLQAQQRGTGHAVQQAITAVADDATVLIVYGDAPLISAATLAKLVAAAGSGLALLVGELPDAGSYGRIVRDANGHVVRIVEKKDASAAESALTEFNTGFMAAPAKRLRDWLGRLTNNNAQGEYYLTDVVALAVADGVEVATAKPATITEVEGINSKRELARLERAYQTMNADELMEQGLTLRDPARFDLRGELEFGRDVEIDINVILEGKVSLGDRVRIGSNCVLRNVRLGAGTEILPNSVIEDSDIGADCRVGPFARVRPGSRIADHAHIGNFVEIKNSEIGIGSKVNHLSYVGDTTMGAGVNIGAGTITANYDGANKHRTIIRDKVSTGANSVLVAPVQVGEGATLGAGTILRKDAPAGELTVGADRQRTVPGWKRPQKAKKD
jgi:bifunctional UDP-N-acetylglucosamine pyrophosphorylase/glucosamine-1-phosphate N-acetyltransferase